MIGILGQGFHSNSILMTPKFKTKFKYSIFLFILGNLLNACVVDDQFEHESPPQNQELLIETQSWYKNQYQSSSSARLVNFIRENINWSEGRTGMYNGYQYVEVPINLTIKNILLKRSPEIFETEGIYHLIIFKSASNQFTPYIFKAEAKSDLFELDWHEMTYLNFENIPESFSGTYSFFKPNGFFVGEYIIESGRILRAVSYKAEDQSGKTNSHTSNARWDYKCTITTYTGYLEFTGGDVEIEYQFEVWDCEFTYVPDQIAPSSPDSGGGGGNEEQPCYEPHPQFHGFLVPCEDNDPCNNFEDLVSKVLNSEGGYVNDPVDRGGTTNRGISWYTWQKAAQPILGRAPTLDNLKNISANDAKKIYKALYWDNINLSDIHDRDLRGLVFDFFVNSGPNAIKELQKTLNALGGNLVVDGIIGSNTIGYINDYGNMIELYNSYKQRRIGFLENIVDKDVRRYLKKNPNATQTELKEHTQLKYKNGWLNRVQKFKEKTTENFET